MVEMAPIKSSIRRRLLRSLVSLSSLYALGPFAYGASTNFKRKADAIWAFQFGTGNGDLISTGCVFRSAGWDELGTEPDRGSWVERQILEQRHSGRYRLIAAKEAIEALKNSSGPNFPGTEAMKSVMDAIASSNLLADSSATPRLK